MKKDLKYFETEIKRITEEFEDYKKKHTQEDSKLD